MTDKVFFQLTEQGLRPAFKGTIEELNDHIAKESQSAKKQAEEHLAKLREQLKSFDLDKKIEDMSFEEIEKYKLEYFDKLFAIKNIEQKLIEHKDYTVKDGYYFELTNIGKDFKFED